jgi:hypothetical protein
VSLLLGIGSGLLAVIHCVARGGERYVKRNGDTVSALPLRPFGVPDLVWPPGMCEACYEPQWSDALRAWEYVEGVVGPCGACTVAPGDGTGKSAR